MAEWTRNAVVGSKEKLQQSRFKAIKDLETDTEKEKKRRQGESAASSKLVAPPLKTQVVQVSASRLRMERTLTKRLRMGMK